MKALTPEQITAALRDACAVAQSADERRGVMLAAIELGVRSFPSYREYAAWLEGLRPWNACGCGKCAVCVNREPLP